MPAEAETWFSENEDSSVECTFGQIHRGLSLTLQFNY